MTIRLMAFTSSWVPYKTKMIEKIFALIHLAFSGVFEMFFNYFGVKLAEIAVAKIN